MVYSQTLSSNEGILWDHKPLISSNGLISSFYNTPLHGKGGFSRKFTSICFNRLGDIVVTGDEKGRIMILCLKRNKYWVACNLGVGITSCVFNSTRKDELLVNCQDETTRCIDIHLKTLVSTLRGHHTPLHSVDSQESGHLALTASLDVVILWNSKDWSRYRTLKPGASIQQAKFACGGKYAVICMQNDTILMWDANTLGLEYRLTLPPEENANMSAFDVSEASGLVAASGDSRKIWVFYYPSQCFIRSILLPVSTSSISQVCFLPTYPDHVSFLSDDGSICFVSLAAKAPCIKMRIYNGRTRVITYSIDRKCKHLAASCSDGCLEFYDLDVAKESQWKAQQIRLENDLPATTESDFLTSRSAFKMSLPAPYKLTKQSNNLSNRNRATDDRAHRHETGDKGKGCFCIWRGLKESELKSNKERLERLLRSYHGYPAKYRSVIWRFLLRLPENREEYNLLLDKGPNPAVKEFLTQYPIQNKKLSRRFHRVVSCIVHWQVLFGETSYLPSLSFPFIKIFYGDDVAAFETIVCILVHWCRNYYEMFPYSPVRMLSFFDVKLSSIDPQLHDHFTRMNLKAQDYAWTPLQSLMTEIFGRDDWLRLWDYLFTYANEPELLYLALLAYIKYSRRALLTFDSKIDIMDFFKNQSSLNIEKFFIILDSLRADFGVLFHTEMFRSLKELPMEDPLTLEYLDKDNKPERKTLQPLWPLPETHYPTVLYYPTNNLQSHIEKRERIENEENEIKSREAIVRELKIKAKELEDTYRYWLVMQENLKEEELKDKTEYVAERRQKMHEKASLEKENRIRKLAHLAQMEEIAKRILEETMEVQAARTRKQKELMSFDNEKESYELKLLKEDEEFSQLEYAGIQRVKEIYEKLRMETSESHNQYNEEYGGDSQKGEGKEETEKEVIIEEKEEQKSDSRSSKDKGDGFVIDDNTLDQMLAEVKLNEVVDANAIDQSEEKPLEQRSEESLGVLGDAEIEKMMENVKENVLDDTYSNEMNERADTITETQQEEPKQVAEIEQYENAHLSNNGLEGVVSSPDDSFSFSHDESIEAMLSNLINTSSSVKENDKTTPIAEINEMLDESSAQLYNSISTPYIIKVGEQGDLALQNMISDISGDDESIPPLDSDSELALEDLLSSEPSESGSKLNDLQSLLDPSEEQNLNEDDPMSDLPADEDAFYKYAQDMIAT